LRVKDLAARRYRGFIPSFIPEEDLRSFRKAGMGRRIGFGNSPAIIVIDVTNAFVRKSLPLSSEKGAEDTVEAISRLIAKARAVDIPIIYTKGYAWRTQEELGRWIDKEDSWSEPGSTLRKASTHAIVNEISPRRGDIVITKPKPSAFFGTQLASVLTYRSVDTVIVTGLTTSGCVRATVVDAFSLNYRAIVPIECVGDRSNISHEVNLFDMSMKYADVVHLERVLAYLEGLRRG